MTTMEIPSNTDANVAMTVKWTLNLEMVNLPGELNGRQDGKSLKLLANHLEKTS